MNKGLFSRENTRSYLIGSSIATLILGLLGTLNMGGLFVFGFFIGLHVYVMIKEKRKKV